MTHEEVNKEGAEEEIEDLEAPAEAQGDVAGGYINCRPTNNCAPVNTVVACNPPTQLCSLPTCVQTLVHEL